MFHSQKCNIHGKACVCVCSLFGTANSEQRTVGQASFHECSILKNVTFMEKRLRVVRARLGLCKAAAGAALWLVCVYVCSLFKTPKTANSKQLISSESRSPLKNVTFMETVQKRSVRRRGSRAQRLVRLSGWRVRVCSLFKTPKTANSKQQPLQLCVTVHRAYLHDQQTSTVKFVPT